MSENSCRRDLLCLTLLPASDSVGGTMSDYGHELAFGCFTTPTASDPRRPVELAVLAEQVGLDLVTFQDNPYQPAFLDTWTLLSFVAARTTSVHLSANVSNLPLRPPAVLARSVASLDRLSGGRVELGLGAGGFWDGVEAMGGRRLTPRDSVQAAEEAIEVIRELWNVAARGGARVDGTFYGVHGAKRGPTPAHDVSIWLGAYKPRMLALTGRRADGWLPSMSFLQPGDLATGNGIIDDAADEAGRRPGDVRRLLNIVGQFASTSRGPLHGPSDQWVEELADLALTDGISTFILASDDADDLSRLAHEVAPAVRELVNSQRTSSAPAPGNRGEAGSQQRTPLAVIPTPPSGIRLSSRQVWDESTRPTGPPSDEQRTYTSQEQAGAQRLVDIHDVLRDEVGQINELVEQVAGGMVEVGLARSRLNMMTLRQNKWTLGTYCESYCRTVTAHHTIEDQALFPRLRGDAPALVAVVDRLEQEHHLLHDVIDAVDRALITFVSVPDGMAELRASVALLSDTLLSHLAYEEHELVEPIARLGVN